MSYHGAHKDKLAPTQLAELDDTRAFQGLTTAQHRFVMLMFQGLSNVEAYRAVYDTSHMQESSIYSAARDAAALPLVTAKLREMRQRLEAQSTLAPNLTRELILNGIQAIALAGDKDSTRLRAFELLGKTVGIDLFRDTIVTEKRVRTVDDVERELKDRLEELRTSLTVEGEARRVDSPAAAAPGARDRRRKPKA